jgi:hypothetical protein
MAVQRAEPGIRCARQSVLGRDFARLARAVRQRHDRAMKNVPGRGLPASFAVASLALSAMAAAAPTPLAPTSHWNVDLGDAHCIAMRNYGTAEAPVILAFKPSPIGDVMQLSVIRPGFKPDVDQYAGTMTVDRRDPVKVSLLGYRAPTKKSRVTSVNLSRDQFDPLRTASTIRLRSDNEVDQTFALSGMAEVTQALDKCVVGLRKYWHIEDAAAEISKPAESQISLPSLFSTNDYPRTALMQHATGLVQMVTLIDEAGKIASCMVIGTSGYASLDAQSCAIVTVRAKFAPALGKDGKPVRSGATLRIRWAMG